MKIDNLRIGNQVKCKISNDAGIYSITAIDGINERVMLSLPRDGSWLPIDKIKPIKITEKILIDAGVKNEYNDLLFDWKRSLVINYFHELQNILYYLYGKQIYL